MSGIVFVAFVILKHFVKSVVGITFVSVVPRDLYSTLNHVVMIKILLLILKQSL